MCTYDCRLTDPEMRANNLYVLRCRTYLTHDVMVDSPPRFTHAPALSFHLALVYRAGGGVGFRLATLFSSGAPRRLAKQSA